jgi:hypothetical protein
MEDAGKLAEQRTGKAMEQAIVQYRQAAPLWHDLHDTAQEAKALEQIGVMSLRLLSGRWRCASRETISAARPTPPEKSPSCAMPSARMRKPAWSGSAIAIAAWTSGR